MRDVGPRVGRLEGAGRRRHRLRAHLDDAIDARQRDEILRRPGILRGVDPAFPFRGPARGLQGGPRDGFPFRHECDEIAVADDLERAGATHGDFVETEKPRAAARLAQHARVEHALRREIVQERRAGELLRQVEARKTAADDTVFGGMLDRRVPGCVAREIYAGGKPPIVVAGVGLAAQKSAVCDGELRRVAAQLRRELLHEQAPHLGADEPDRAAGDFDRQAAGRVAFVRGALGVAGHDAHAGGLDVELLGGDLHHRGQHPLADLDPAGRDRHPAGGAEPDPPIEPRIGGEQRR